MTRIDAATATPPEITLEMHAETSVLRCHAGTETRWETRYGLGIDSLARACFRSAPPRPLEIEHAIEVTEEQVIGATAVRASAQWPPTRCLRFGGPGAALLADALAAHRGPTAAIPGDAVEALFNRLVDRSQGRPATHDAVPTDPRFCAALLMLRECLHHLGFQEVVLVPDAV